MRLLGWFILLFALALSACSAAPTPVDALTVPPAITARVTELPSPTARASVTRMSTSTTVSSSTPTSIPTQTLTPLPSATPTPPGGSLPLIAVVGADPNGGYSVYYGRFGRKLAPIVALTPADTAKPGLTLDARLALTQDGQKLLYFSADGAANALYVLDIPSGAVEKIVDVPMSIEYEALTWQPGTGPRFAVLSYYQGGGPDPILLVDAQSKTLRPVGSGWFPEWSRDGSKLLYGAVTGWKAFDPVNGSLQPADPIWPRACRVLDKGVSSMSCSYWPGMDQIVLQQFMTNGSQQQSLLDRAGLTRHLLVQSPPGTFTAAHTNSYLVDEGLLSPDGARVLVHIRPWGTIGEFVYAADLSGAPISVDAAASQFATIVYRDPIWAPDGQSYLAVGPRGLYSYFAIFDARTNRPLRTFAGPIYSGTQGDLASAFPYSVAWPPAGSQ